MKHADKNRVIEGEPHIWCHPCQQYLPATGEFFYRSKYSSNGFNSCCKACYHEYPSMIRREALRTAKREARMKQRVQTT